MNDETQRYLELLDQRIAVLEKLAKSLVDARQDVVGLDINGLEARIAQQERLCEQVGALDRLLRRFCHFTLRLLRSPYASSQVDKRKVGNLALAIQVAFQQLGVFDTSNTKIPLSDSEAVPFTQVQVVENAERTGDFRKFVQPMKGILSPVAPPPLKDVQSDLLKALAPEIDKKVVTVTARPEGIVVSLREVGFYESGSSSIRPSSQGAIDRLAAVLSVRNEALRIEGHTDNIPIHNQHFDSNWELSTARATDLVKLFILRYHFDASRLSASGFAQYHPVSLNDSDEDRARNRRVDIVILNPTKQY